MTVVVCKAALLQTLSSLIANCTEKPASLLSHTPGSLAVPALPPKCAGRICLMTRSPSILLSLECQQDSHRLCLNACLVCFWRGNCKIKESESLMPGVSSSWWRGEGRGGEGDLFSSSLIIVTNPHGVSSFETSPKSNHFPKVPSAPWLPQLKLVSPLRFFLPWWVIPSNYEPKIKKKKKNNFPFPFILVWPPVAVLTHHDQKAH